MISLTCSTRLLATGAFLGTAIACCPGGGWQEPETIPLGVGADLVAVVRNDECKQMDCWLAAGAGGTVVAWEHSSFDAELIDFKVDHFNVGDADLTDILAAGSGWWAIGKGGTLVVSEDEGGAWQPVDLGTSADLYGIARHGAWLVVVGDETISVRRPDGDWVVPLAPPGGWGRLRGTYADELRVYAVGLDGVAWSAVEPAGEWVAEDVGVDSDLLAVHRIRGLGGDRDRVAIVGTHGTLLVGGGTDRHQDHA